MKTRSRMNGMTLIEVVVALALLGLLSMGMFSTFDFARRSFSQVSRASDASNEVWAAQRIIRRAIQSAHPIQPSLTPPVHYGLEGTSDSLELSAPSVASAAQLGYLRYRFFIRHRGTRNDLMVSWGDDEEALLRDVQSVTFEYASRREFVDGTSSLQWSSEWTGEASPPALVRLTVTFSQSTHDTWPVLVVAPLITEATGCDFDVVAQSCRAVSS